MAYENKRIIDILELIDSKKILLPAIQRKFLWTEEQITRLMDSIMKNYPFGTFLFWKIKKEAVNNKGYSMYEFIKNYHERDRYKNEPAAQPFNVTNENKDDTILAVLDGQQRLTSLYIAIFGSLAKKKYRAHSNNDSAYPKKELYFDLNSQVEIDEGGDEEILYDFKFFTEDEAKEQNNGKLWYPVKEIVQYAENSDLMRMFRKSEWADNDVALDNLVKLWERIKRDKIVNYFEQESDDIDSVLDIFVRVNSGGTVLSKTDLLFSTIVSSWNEARDEIDNLVSSINKIGGYKFTNDFIMRACLYLMDLSISLKVESFAGDCLKNIKEAWPNIKSAILDTIHFMYKIGFNGETIISYSAIMPILYYRYKQGKDAFKDPRDSKTNKPLFDEEMEIRKFLVVSQIKHIFGQSRNSTLSTLREKGLKQNGKFVFSDYQDFTFTGDRNLKYTEEDIEAWVDEFEKGQQTFMLLSLLYPHLKYEQTDFEQDHMHPFSAFEGKEALVGLVLPNGAIIDKDKICEWKHKRNTLPNLQMLGRLDNESKNDTPFDEWIKNTSNKNNTMYLPRDIDYSLSNFDEFYEKRKELLLAKLKEVLL